MKCSDINIRDPFIVSENGKYYMYGSRAKGFGIRTGGFDVYVSEDLIDWSEPIECFDSEKYGLNKSANWAPEVHKYKGAYYMFATFTQENGLKGTYILRSEGLLGPFVPHSHGAVTPADWECLDGTLYIEDGVPYMIFCHEHVQIFDGTMCYLRLNDELTAAVGEAVTMFAASEYPWSDDGFIGESGRVHYVTDGPFAVKADGKTFLIWSSVIKRQYAELITELEGGIGGRIRHLAPLLDSDGGHGMIFDKDGEAYFTYHTPNTSECEHPAFAPVILNSEGIRIKE